MNLRYENQKLKQGYTHIIGCDEVGRGCLAGPVVAAAVALPPQVESEKLKVIKSAGIRDSKLLSADKREYLAAIIKDSALAWGIGVVDEKTIDKINIHQATLLAMKQAVEMLLASPRGVILRPSASEAEESQSPIKRSFGCTQDDASKRVLIVIDGKFTIPNFNIEQEAIVDGDNKILSIAAASIIAKVYRDNLMRKLHQQYPIYNFAQHKGYGTLFHRTTILQNGLSPIHRKSFCKNFIA
jgi:ribonuclease HII